MISSIIYYDDIVCVTELNSSTTHIGILRYNESSSIILYSPRMIEIKRNKVNLLPPMNIGDIDGFIRFGSESSVIIFVPTDDLLESYINEISDYIDESFSNSMLDNFVYYHDKVC